MCGPATAARGRAGYRGDDRVMVGRSGSMGKHWRRCLRVAVNVGAVLDDIAATRRSAQAMTSEDHRCLDMLGTFILAAVRGNRLSASEGVVMTA